MSRPHAVTNTRPSGTPLLIGESSLKSQHGRAVSELRLLAKEHTICQLPRQGKQHQVEAELRGERLDASPEHPVVPSTEPSIHLCPTTSGASDTIRSTELESTVSRKLSESDSIYIGENGDDFNDELLTLTTPATVESDDLRRPGYTFLSVPLEDLVDRLLSPLMSRPDAKFVSTFLCLYRKFAAPSELMTAIISRFRVVSDSQEAHISKFTSQLRYLGVLAQWVSGYPGDFAHPTTRQIATQFLSGLGTTPIFAAARAELSNSLEIVVVDDDTNWARSDSDKSGARKVTAIRHIFLIINNLSSQLIDPIEQDNIGSIELEGPVKHEANRHSATLSTTSSLSGPDSLSSISRQTQLDLVEKARQQARFLAPNPKIYLAKAQWHRLMEIPSDEIAQELTRIDWIMYSSIRPRDLVRHVTLTPDERDKCKGLENVDRMINHFNHVAFWVANLILLRDKPKHRARILERFMRIAWVSCRALNPR